MLCYAWQTLRSRTNKTKGKTKGKDFYFQPHSREASALDAKFAFRLIYPVSLLFLRIQSSHPLPFFSSVPWRSRQHIAAACPSHCFIKAVFLCLCFDLHMQGKEIALAFASAAGEREFFRGGDAGYGE